jgi:tetratricopeptide (TPR) repeat protein
MRRVLRLAAVATALLAALPLPAAPPGSPPATRPSAGGLIRRAEAELRQRRYAEALDLARRAADQAEGADDVRRARRLAVLCRLRGGDEGAADAAEQLLAEFPSLRDDADVQLALAMFHQRHGHHQRAYEAYGRAAKLLSDAARDADAGQAYLAQAEIIRRFYSVIPEGFGPEARAWSATEKEQHAIDDAIRIYNVVLTLDIGDDAKAQTLHRAGRTLAELGRWEFAERGIAFYRRCVREYPQADVAATCQYEIGQAYRKFERYTDAVREMRAFLERYPQARRAPAVRTMLRHITEPHLQVWAPWAVRPGGRPKLYWRSRNVRRVRLVARRVDLVDRAMTDGVFVRVPIEAPPDAAEPVADRSFQTPDAGEHRWHVCGTEGRTPGTEPVELPLDSPGAYHVHAVGDDGAAEANTVAIISDLTLVAKADARDMVVFAIRGDRPAAGAEAAGVRNLYGGRRAFRERRRADDSGLVRLSTLTGGERANRWLAAGRDGDHQAFCTVDAYYCRPWGWPYPWRVYGFTDCGVYPPGEKVRYKQLVRAVRDGAYHSEAGRQVRVEVRGPLGETVFTREHETDAFGAVAGELPLPVDARPGDYRIDLTVDRRDVSFSESGANVFRVMEAEEPHTLVSVRPERDAFGLGDEMQFLVTAQTEQGAPAADRELRLTIRKEPLGPAASWPTACPWLRVGDEDAEPLPRPFVSRGGIETNEDGQALVTVTAEGYDDSPRLGAAYFVTVELDGSTAQAQVRATPEPRVLGVRPQRQVHAAGERATVHVRAEDAFGRAANPPPLSLEMRRADSDVVLEWRTVVLRDGQGSTAISPPGPGRYVVRVEAEDASPAECTFHVAPAEGETLSPRPEELTVIPSAGRCAIGETLRVLVLAPRGVGPVLLTGEADELLFARTLDASAGWALAELPVTAELSPNFTLVATAVRDGDVLRAAAEVVVPPTHRLRDGRAEPVDGRSLRVKVTDRRTGEPVAAQVTLSVLAGPPGIERPGVERFFHGFTRDVQVQWSDSSRTLFQPTRRPLSRSLPRRRRGASTGDPATEPPRFTGDAPATTLLWSADVRTGADGVAEVPLDVPEGQGGLTLWAVAIDGGQRVGSTTALFGFSETEPQPRPSDNTETWKERAP